MDKRLLDINGLTEKEFLDNYKASDFERPSVTADILIFSNTDKLEILMIKRGGHPFIDTWALVGGFAEPDESIDQTATRELFEETGLTNIPLQQLYLFGDTNRDPRTWIVTQAYISLVNRNDVNPIANDDARECAWWGVSLVTDNDLWTLTLENNGEVITSTLKIRENETVFGISYDMEIVGGYGIAFDHAKMICRGLIKLQNCGIINEWL